MGDSLLSLDAFIRSVGVNQASPHAFFLGAGASVSSGLPSAWRCIWEWKRSIFLTNHPGMEAQFSEISLTGVQEKIQRWLDGRGYPPLGDPSEYGFYIERCYPIPEHRRLFFQNVIQQANPHLGYKLLCLLAKATVIRSVWTTNFDGLAARAATTAGITPIEVGIDSKVRLPRAPRQGELLCVSLHGDYRYDPLKNTDEELQRQEAELEAALADELESTHLIVSGYSGRDQSVMQALTKAYGRRGPGSLYWCVNGDSDPPAPVMDLLRTARGSGRIACHVPTSGFDDLLLRLSFHCLSGDLLKRAQGIASGAARGAVPESTPFTLELFPLGGIVKSNAFPIQCPSDVLQFEVADLPERGAWKYLKETTDGSDIIAGPFGGKVLALGTVDAIQDAFGDRLRSSIVRAPIDQKDLAYEDGVVVSILRRALIRYCEKKLGLRSDGKGLVWDGSPSETKWVGGKKHAIHQAALLSLRAIGREQFLVLKPSLVVADEHGDRLPEESILPIKLQILGYQHNSRFNDAANAWRDRLFPDPQNTWEFPPDCGSAFRFRIKRGPLFAAIGDPARKGPINVAPAVEQHLTQRGVQLEEPPLVFTRKTGGGTVKDFHPIRGVVQNRPFDYSLTLGGAVAAHLRWYCLPGNRGQDIRVLSRRIAAPEGSTTNRA